MNSQSKLLLVAGVFVFTATCSGQRPSCEKPMMHFAADIIKVDSILSTSHRNLKSDKDSIRFELIWDKDKRKRGPHCPVIVEMDQLKKI